MMIQFMLQKMVILKKLKMEPLSIQEDNAKNDQDQRSAALISFLAQSGLQSLQSRLHNIHGPWSTPDVRIGFEKGRNQRSKECANIHWIMKNRGGFRKNI